MSTLPFFTSNKLHTNQAFLARYVNFTNISCKIVFAGSKTQNNTCTKNYVPWPGAEIDGIIIVSPMLPEGILEIDDESIIQK